MSRWWIEHEDLRWWAAARGGPTHQAAAGVSPTSILTDRYPEGDEGGQGSTAVATNASRVFELNVCNREANWAPPGQDRSFERRTETRRKQTFAADSCNASTAHADYRVAVVAGSPRPCGGDKDRGIVIPSTLSVLRPASAPCGRLDGEHLTRAWLGEHPCRTVPLSRHHE